MQASRLPAACWHPRCKAAPGTSWSPQLLTGASHGPKQWIKTQASYKRGQGSELDLPAQRPSIITRCANAVKTYTSRVVASLSSTISHSGRSRTTIVCQSVNEELSGPRDPRLPEGNDTKHDEPREIETEAKKMVANLRRVLEIELGEAVAKQFKDKDVELLVNQGYETSEDLRKGVRQQRLELLGLPDARLVSLLDHFKGTAVSPQPTPAPSRFLGNNELPPESSSLGADDSSDNSPDDSTAAAEALHDAAAAGQPPSGSGDRTAGSQDGSGSAVVQQWEVELPSSPGAGVLGSGITGDVIAGSLGEIPVAVKWGPAGSKYERWLEHEGDVYLDLEPLQGKYIPVLLYFGPAAGGVYFLVTRRVFGRRLRGGGSDAHLLPKALDALRAVHSMGYLHGDIRLPNFLVDDEEQVFLLDFGNAKHSSSRSEMQQEEEKLVALLQGGELRPIASKLQDRPVLA